MGISFGHQEEQGQKDCKRKRGLISPGSKKKSVVSIEQGQGVSVQGFGRSGFAGAGLSIQPKIAKTVFSFSFCCF
jgi:hypothetical protein